MTVRDPNRPNVAQVAPLVRAYYAKPGNGAGGSLHVVLDDGNFETKFVEGCRDEAARRGDADAVAIADLLLRMTMTQRRKVAANKR